MSNRKALKKFPQEELVRHLSYLSENEVDTILSKVNKKRNLKRKIPQKTLTSLKKEFEKLKGQTVEIPISLKGKVIVSLGYNYFHIGDAVEIVGVRIKTNKCLPNMDFLNENLEDYFWHVAASPAVTKVAQALQTKYDKLGEKIARVADTYGENPQRLQDQLTSRYSSKNR